VALVAVVALVGVVVAVTLADDDDDDDGAGSEDEGATEQATGDTCAASLPAELQLADCGYAVSPSDFDNVASVGFVLENVSSQPVTNVLLDITARTGGGGEASGTFLLGYLAPGEQSAGGYEGLSPPPDVVDGVTISYSGGPAAPPPLASDYSPLGTLSVSDVEIGPARATTRGPPTWSRPRWTGASRSACTPSSGIGTARSSAMERTFPARSSQRGPSQARSTRKCRTSPT
jgi:hypothetical protein